MKQFLRRRETPRPEVSNASADARAEEGRQELPGSADRQSESAPVGSPTKPAEPGFVSSVGEPGGDPAPISTVSQPVPDDSADLDARLAAVARRLIDDCVRSFPIGLQTRWRQRASAYVTAGMKPLAAEARAAGELQGWIEDELIELSAARRGSLEDFRGMRKAIQKRPPGGRFDR